MSLQTLASGMKQCEDFMLFQVRRDKYLAFAFYLIGKNFGDNFFFLYCETKQNFLVQGRDVGTSRAEKDWDWRQ